MLITYEDWYELQHTQAVVDRVENAYDILNEHKTLEGFMTKEDMVQIVMESHYENDLEEFMAGVSDEK